MLQNGRRESHQDGSVRAEMNRPIWQIAPYMRIAESENCDTSRVPELLGHTVDFTYQKWAYLLTTQESICLCDIGLDVRAHLASAHHWFPLFSCVLPQLGLGSDLRFPRSTLKEKKEGLFYVEEGRMRLFQKTLCSLPSCTRVR